jgi:hypothetical protein
MGTCTRVLAIAIGVAAVISAAEPARASITCRDILKQCKSHKHPLASCMRSYEICYKTGRWIGPDGVERPVTRR